MNLITCEVADRSELLYSGNWIDSLAAAHHGPANTFFRARDVSGRYWTRRTTAMQTACPGAPPEARGRQGEAGGAALHADDVETVRDAWSRNGQEKGARICVDLSWTLL